MHKVCEIFYRDEIIIILINMNMIKKNTKLRLKQCFIGIFVFPPIIPKKNYGKF